MFDFRECVRELIAYTLIAFFCGMGLVAGGIVTWCAFQLATWFLFIP